MKKIKFLTVLCAIALATALTGCGGKNNGGSSSGKNDKGASKSTDLETIIAEINNYVYKNEPFNIEDSSDIGRIVIKNDTMYVSKAKYDYPEASEGEDGEVGILEEVSTEGDETDAKKAEINFDAGEPDGSDADIEAPKLTLTISSYGLDGSKKGDLVKDYGENSYLNYFDVDDNGNYYMLNYKYYYDDQQVYHEEYALQCLDKDGNEKWNVPVTSEDSADYFYPYSAQVNKDKLILMTNKGIDLYDLTGQRKGRIGDNNPDAEWGSAFLLKNGKLVVTTYEGDSPKLVSYDIESGNKGEIIELPVNPWSYSIMAGNTHDMILSSSTGMYYFDIGDKEIHKFIDYIASDLNCYSISNFYEQSADTFFGSYYDDSDEGGNFVVAKFTKVDPASIADKKVITIGGMYIGTDIKKNILKFNRTSDTSKIVVKDYSAEASGDDYDSIIKVVNDDVIAGALPDIMMLNNSMDISNFFAKGVFEPLNDYFDSDPSLDRSQFMENVLNAFTYDGKLYCVAPSFSVSTLVGKKSVVGDKNMSLEQLQDLAKSIGPETTVFQDMTREQFLRTYMYYNQSEFVDLSTGEAKFDSPEFIKLLEYAKTLPEEINYEDDQDWEYSSAAFRENRALVSQLNLGDFRDSIGYYKYVMFADDLGFIGFPTSKGSGHAIGFDAAYAISANSENKDEAWKFISAYLSEDFQNSIDWGFPINKNALKAKGEKAKKPQTYKNEKGEDEEIDETYWIGDKEIKALPPTQAEIDSYIKVLESADRLVNYSESILNIMLEETGGYFNGQKDAESVAKVIQSRVQIYVNENR